MLLAGVSKTAEGAVNETCLEGLAEDMDGLEKGVPRKEAPRTNVSGSGVMLVLFGC